MANNDPTQHFYTPAAELNSIASQVLSKDATCLDELSVKQIGRSFGHETYGVFRVAGSAHTSAGEEEWSAVAKILTVPDNRSAAGEIGNREIEVYRSGVFDELCGGVRAAKCYAIQLQESAQYLWLEDLSAAPQSPWSAPYFIQCAHNVGQFNAYWPEDKLPEWK